MNKHILVAVAAVAGMIGMVASCNVPSAKADSSDDIFIAVLDNFSVPYGDPDSAIEEGHKVCAILDKDPVLILAGFDVMDTFPDMTFKQAGQFTGAAVGAYCTQHDNLYNDTQGA